MGKEIILAVLLLSFSTTAGPKNKTEEAGDATRARINQLVSLQ